MIDYDDVIFRGLRAGISQASEQGRKQFSRTFERNYSSRTNLELCCAFLFADGYDARLSESDDYMHFKIEIRW